MTTRLLQQLILFSLLALISYGIVDYFEEEVTETDKPFTKGYSVEKIQLKITDESGKLTAKFDSPSLIRYTDSPIVYIQTPKFWTYTDGKEHWFIRSKKAEYNAESGEVGLYEKLIAKTVNDQTVMQFSANNLLIDLKTKMAHTTDGITLKQEFFTMTGQVAQFDLNNESLEVNNNIKAVYKPTKKGKNNK